MKPTTDWNYTEFHAFLMLYAANADSHITAEEENLIQPTLSKEAYEDIKKRFKMASDVDVLNTIISFKDKFFPDETAKNALLEDMQKIYNADKKYDRMEKTLNGFLKRIM